MTPTKAILVTGSSSGIGLATALYMAQHDFLVFATVRKGKDEEYLQRLNEPNLIPVCPLDLSKAEDIASTVETVKRTLNERKIQGLYAVVNNAGGGEVAPIELMDIDKFRTELETRILGPVALLQGLLPLVRAAHGRIIWIVTPSLMPIPYVASIHAADFAVNCIARTLQIELKPWNIPIVQIRCGGVKTAGPDKSDRDLTDSLQKWSPEQIALYGEALKKEQTFLTEFDTKRTEPEKVAEVVYKALVAKNPKRRYQIGYMAGMAQGLEYLPQPVVDSIMESRN